MGRISAVWQLTKASMIRIFNRGAAEEKRVIEELGLKEE